MAIFVCHFASSAASRQFCPFVCTVKTSAGLFFTSSALSLQHVVEVIVHRTSLMLHFVPWEKQSDSDFASGSGLSSRVQVDGVDLIEAAVDASCLEEEAVVWAGRHGVTAPCLALQVLQQVKS